MGVKNRAILDFNIFGKAAMLRMRWFVLLSWAGLISYQLFTTAGLTNSEYYKRWPLQGDTISYWTRDISLSKPSHTQNSPGNYRINALDGAMRNGKDPLRTAFFALLPKSAPASINGHLYFSAVTAFIFIFMLMVVVLKRSDSFLYALAAPGVALLPNGLFDPMYGLPSKLPDMPASFLFGAAVFALFSPKDSAKSELKWIFVAGLLLGLATLARFQLWIYGLFTLGPITVLFAVKRYILHGRQAPDIRYFVVYPFTLIAGLALASGYFIVMWTDEMFRFYSIAGYSLNSTVYTSLFTTGRQFLDCLGLSAILASTIVFSGFFSIKKLTISTASIFEALSILWALFAYPILLFVIMRVESIREQTYYIVPGLLLFLLTPFVEKNSSVRESGFNTFAFCLVLILPFAAYGKIYGYLNSEDFVYPREANIKLAQFQHELAELVAVNIPQSPLVEPITIDSNFFYYSRMIELLVKSKFDRDSTSLMVFEIRQSQWKLSYTGDEESDKALIMGALKQKVDIFVALTKPLPEAKMNTFADDYTEHLALYVNQELSAHPEMWENRGSRNGPFGEVTVYRNLVRRK